MNIENMITNIANEAFNDAYNTDMGMEAANIAEKYAEFGAKEVINRVTEAFRLFLVISDYGSREKIDGTVSLFKEYLETGDIDTFQDYIDDNNND